MKALYTLLLGACIAGAASAQHEEHTTQAAASPQQQPEQQQPLQQPPAAPHAGHDANAAPATPPDPHAGHQAAPVVEADPHAAHVAPAPQASANAAHQGHEAGTRAGAGTQAELPPPPEAFSGPEHAADLFFDAQAMAAARAAMRSENGEFRGLFVLADQLEVRRRDGDEFYVWDAQGWYGGDIDKFWVKTEGEGELNASPEEFELQTLWSHAFHPWFDLQAGLRWDFAPGLERSHFVLGVQGLLPYRFELDAAAFVSDDGDLSGRIEGEYDLWLTQRLILQPRVELQLSAQDLPQRAIGEGVGAADVGLRLQYQVTREFAPYAGLQYERLFGATADYARLAGNDADGWSLVLGLRTWF